MRKLYLRALLLAALSLVCVSRPAAALSLRLNTPTADIVTAPGTAVAGVLEIENPTDKNMAVKVYAEDWAYKPVGTGEKEFFVAGTLSDSASKWIVLNPLEFTMAPFSQVKVNYTVTVPARDVSGAYHTVVFFETAAGSAQTAQGATVLVSARIGAIFKIEISGAMRREGKIETIEITPPKENKPATFAVRFRNTGNSDIKLQGTALILDKEGLVKGRGRLEDLVTQGGMAASRASQWIGKLAPGEYDIIFTFDLGEGEILTEDRKMTVE